MQGCRYPCALQVVSHSISSNQRFLPSLACFLIGRSQRGSCNQQTAAPVPANAKLDYKLKSLCGARSIFPNAGVSALCYSILLYSGPSHDLLRWQWLYCLSALGSLVAGKHGPTCTHLAVIIEHYMCCSPLTRSLGKAISSPDSPTFAIHPDPSRNSTALAFPVFSSPAPPLLFPVN